MSSLLGAIAESGSTLDPKRLWRAAGSRQVRGASIWSMDRSTRRVLRMQEGEQTPADYAFLLPDGEQEPTRDCIWVGLHGMLYNLPELARQSEFPHYESHEQQSDVIRHCYQRWGNACFPRFRGSFACAILDLQHQKLLLARDHLGSKSLFFTIHRGFCFASSIQAVLEISGSSRTLNACMVRDWLLDIPSDDPSQTFFDRIVRLPPATRLELDLSAPMVPSVTEFWKIDDACDQRLKREDAEERLRTLLAESIELTTRDVQTVGVTLSGGLDSSLLMAALRKCKGEGYPIHSFTSVSSTRASRKEESAVRAVSELCQSESHLVGYNCQRIPGEIDSVLSELEEPVASPVLFSHRELYQAAQSTRVPAVLNGHGSDSLFAGSNSHLVTAAASLCRRGRPLKACTMLANATSGYRRVQLFKSVAGASLPSQLKAVLRPRSRPEWIRHQWFEKHVAGNSKGAGERPSTLRAQLVRELRARSLPHTMRIEESASEVSFVSVRSPYLAPELVEFALSLPEEFLIGSDGYTKSILRSASTDLLPATIRECRERVGFSVPAAEWLRSLSEWASEALAEIRHLPFIDAYKVHKLWASFQRSGSNDWQQAMALWQLIFLARWTKGLEVEF